MTGLADLRGMLLPAPTVFDEEGELDEPLFAEIVEFYVGKGVDGLFFMGSFAQGAAMSTPQRRRVIEIAVEVADHRVPVVPNVSAVDPYTSRELALVARDVGADGIAMIGPSYYPERTAEEIVAFFRMLDEGIEMPLFIYNSNLHQGYSISPTLMAMIKEAVPRLVAMCPGNEAVLDFLHYQRVLGDEVKIFGGAAYVVPAFDLGMAGICNPPCVFAIEAGMALVRAAQHGNLAEAVRMQKAFLRYIQELEGFMKLPSLGSTNGSWGRFRPGHLEALRHVGFDVKMFPRWPTARMDETDRNRLHACIDRVQAEAGAISAGRS